MLDQNTDRMWYVIGAVIVCAAIIFLLNSTMPNLFASVGDTFTNKTEEVTDLVPDIGNEMTDGVMPEIPNLLKSASVVEGRYVSHADGSVAVTETSANDALSDYIPVQAGKQYTFLMPRMGGHLRVVYYDADHVFITGKYRRELSRLTSTAPVGAKYARVSAKFEMSDIHPYAVPVEEWWYGVLQ